MDPFIPQEREAKQLTISKSPQKDSDSFSHNNNTQIHHACITYHIIDKIILKKYKEIQIRLRPIGNNEV